MPQDIDIDAVVYPPSSADVVIPPLDRSSAESARMHHGTLTKPPGSLGALEDIPARLAALQGAPFPSARPAHTLIFASDHTAAKHGVSPYPREVTAKMVENFVRGGAAASVLAREQSIPLTVVDVGVETPYDLSWVVRSAELVSAVRVRREAIADTPEGDLLAQHTLGQDMLEACFNAGARAVRELAPTPQVLILGEMGIGNTTLASALSAALLGRSAEELVGPGTGAQGALLAQKISVVDRALARVRDAVGDELAQAPWVALSALGGKEMAAMAGAAFEARKQSIAVVVDGFISTAAVFAVARAVPAVQECLFFGHRSDEPGHALLLDALGARPLLSLGMRLGEASGALAAFPLIELACALHGRMATFASAGVPDKDGTTTTPPVASSVAPDMRGTPWE